MMSPEDFLKSVDVNTQQGLDYITANTSTPKDVDEDISNVNFLGKVKALSNTVNIAYASINKNESFKAPVSQEFKDEHYGTEWTSMAETKYVNARVNDGFNDYLLDNPAESWEDLAKKERYFKELRRDREIFAKEIPIVPQLVGGLLVGFLDIDTLVTAGFGTIPKVANTLSTIYKASKVNKLKSGLMGASVGASLSLSNEALYQTVTGDKSNESLAHATVLGAVFGGGLGVLAGKSKLDAVSGRNTSLDPELENVKSILLEKEGALKHAESQKVQYESTLDYINKESKSYDSATTMRNFEIENLYKADVKESNALNIKTTEDVIKFKKSNEPTFKQESKLLETINTKINETPKIKATLKELGNSLKKVESKLNTATTKLNTYTEKLAQAKVDKKASSVINKIKASITKHKEQVKVLSKESKSVTRSIDKNNKAIATPEEVAQVKVLQDSTSKYIADSVNLKNVSDTANTNHKELQEVTRKKKTRLDNLLNKYTSDVRLKGDYAKYNGVSKNDLAQGILEKTNHYKELSSKLADGSMTKEDYVLRGAKTETTIERLTKEIGKKEEELSKLKDYADVLSTSKEVPSWMRKLIISPISKLQTSDNPKVRAVARMLHAGTINLGAVVGTTAHRIKSNLDTLMNHTNLEILSLHKQALKDGTYKGDYSAYKAELMTHHYRALDDLVARARTYINPAESAIKQKEDFTKGLNTENLEFPKSTPEYFVKSSKILSNYYEGIHAYGKRLSMDGFKTSASKGYINRSYSMDKINELGFDESHKLLLDAMLKKQADLGNVLTKDMPLYKELERKAYGAIQGALDRKERILSMVESTTERAYTKESPLQTREIDVDYSDIRSLLEDDLEVLTSTYAFRMHGNLALQDKFGFHNKGDLDILMNELKVTPSERRYLNIAFDTIKGSREILQNPYSAPQRIIKMLSSLSNVMHVGGFGANTISEVATMTARYGFGNTFSKLWGSSKDIANFYATGTISDKNQFLSFIHLHSSKTNSNITNVENFNLIEGADKVQRFLDGTSHKLAVWGGLLPLTDVMRTASMSAGLDYLARLSAKKGLTSAEVSRLEGFGLTVNDLPALKKALQVDDTGKIANYDIKSYGKLEQRVLDGLLESVDRTIMNGNGMTLPPFMTDNGTGAFMSKVIFKFLRYPIESYERLLLRGIQEGDATQIMSVALNTMLWSGVYMMKDAILPDDKKKYQAEGWEAKLLKDSLIMNSWLGVAPMAADLVAGYGLGENVTNDFKPSNVVWNDFKKLRSGVISVNVPFSKVELDIAKGTGYALGLHANFGEYLKADNDKGE